MVFDREKEDQSLIKAFKSNGFITSLTYGPYDNGHILVGTSLGDFFAFNAIDLRIICQVKVAMCPVTSIVIEPTQLVLCGMAGVKEVTSLTFIE